MMTNRQVEVKFSDETTKLESALIAGKESNGGSISMYVGPLDLDELHHNLFLVNTGVIKILTRELGVKLDDCDDFLISAITEALVYEWNTEKGHVPNPEFSKVVKYRND
jgi:hypothetical protein